MPKLPKGSFKRLGRKAYYTRSREGGADQWISLGTDYNEALRELRIIRRRAEPRRGQEVSVASAARDWLAIRIANGRNETGQKLAARRVEMYLKPFMGHMLVSKITPETARRYRVWLEERCRSKTTVGHVLADARNFLYWAEESGLIDRAPVPRRWLPRVPEREPDRLFDEEVERLAALQELLGHASIETTQRYARLSEDLVRREVERVGLG